MKLTLRSFWVRHFRVEFFLKGRGGLHAKKCIVSRFEGFGADGDYPYPQTLWIMDSVRLALCL